MEQDTIIALLVAGWLVLAAVVFVTLLFIPAPYGRYASERWGPTLPARLGWLIMEAPAALVFAGLFALGSQRESVTAWAFLAMWETHYVYRAFLYPFTLRDEGRRMPLSIAAMAIVFNCVNASLNALWLFHAPGRAEGSWLADPRFLAGATLFAAGLLVNRRADATLCALRPPGGSGYRVPQGGLYRWISCPNYLGEIVQWTGWALATWSLPGLGFAVWTAANLVPRARANHRWYVDSFPDYPEDRKALVPGLW